MISEQTKIYQYYVQSTPQLQTQKRRIIGSFTVEILLTGYSFACLQRMKKYLNYFSFTSKHMPLYEDANFIIKQKNLQN